VVQATPVSPMMSCSLGIYLSRYDGLTAIRRVASL
jgi:hypothetical protein